MRYLLLLFISLAIFAPSPVWADKAWRNVTFEANYPWHAGLGIRFEPDEAQCKKQYGSRWRVKCAAPLGGYGEYAKGVKMTPGAPGHWEWQTPNALVFLPDNAASLKPDTVYKVDISGLVIPPHVQLDRKQGQCRTLARGVRLLENKFWIDPAPSGVHRVTAVLEFNFPVPEGPLKVNFSPPAGCAAGKPEMVFSQERDKLNISWPIHQLPDAPGQATIALPGFGQISWDDGLIFQPVSVATFVQNLPSSRDIFKITGMRLASELDDALNRHTVLEMETSLHVTPQDVLESLHLWELPPYNGKGATTPYDWGNAPAISADILRQATRVVPVPLQESGVPQGKFRFWVDMSPNRYLLARVQNLAAATGHKIDSWQGVAQAPPQDGNIAFLQPGHILPASGLLDFYGINLDAVHWEVQLIEEAFLALFAQGAWDVFTEPLAKTGVELDAVSQRATGRLPLVKKGLGHAQHATLDLGKTLREMSGSPSGLAVVSLWGLKDGKKCSQTSKVILATDLALLVKRDARGSLHCFTRLLGQDVPAAGARISILGTNGRAVAEGHANADGYALLPSLAGLERENKPVAAIARLGTNLGWLPLNDSQREVNFTEFVKGATHAGPNSLLAFVFSQRGIYRPGDELHFGCIPRRGDFSPVTADLPLYVEILDPRGIAIWKKTITAGAGLVDLTWQSPEDSLTGPYICNVRTGKGGAILGSASVRMEHFQPEVMKMKLDSPKTKGWLSAATAPQAIGWLQNLYGLPACGHRISAKLLTSKADFVFPEYPGWIFTDPMPFLGQGHERKLPESLTDGEGRAVLALPSDIFGTASSRIVILAEGFEAAGGRTVSAQAVFLTSPMSKVLGYRFGGSLTNPQFILKDSVADIDFIAIDSDLNKVAWPGVEFTLLKRAPITSLIADGQGGYRYDEVPQDLELHAWRENIGQAGYHLPLDTAIPGDYLLVARSSEGHILAQIPYNVAGDALSPADSPLAASKTRLKLDKAAYDAGDEILVSFNLPYAATGLLSLEREGVHAWSWVKAHAGENMAKIRIPEDFEGQGHIVATFVRSQTSDAIYMAPLAYAAAPFTANIARRDMGLKIAAPATGRPGSRLEFAVSARKRGKAIVFAVDEGILQLGHFSKPEPLSSLLGNRALDVTTLQTADLLMPEHGRLSRRIAAFGGGADSLAFGAKFQNPFKRRNEPPVVFWSGIVDAGPEPTPVQVDIPTWYGGQIRLMAVGAGQDSAGFAETPCAIAGPVVLTPHLPLAVAPGDQFDGAIVLANTTGRRCNVRLAVNTALQKQTPLPQQVQLAPGEEKAIAFTLKAKDEPGAEPVIFSIIAPEYSVTRTVEVAVRPASPMRTTLQAGHISPGGDLPPGRSVMGYGSNQELMLSPLPLPLVAGLGRYLETYPYGCAEQLTSRAFAQAILVQWPNAPSKNRDKLFQAAHNVIQNRFQEGNGVALWPNGQPDLLLTAYIGDYLLYLREAGLSHDAELLHRICDALAWNCALNETSLNAARASAYAIWVLAREGRVVTQLLEELIQNMENRGLYTWPHDLTGVLIAASMREMRLEAPLALEKLVASPQGWFDDYAQAALTTTILARYFPELLTEQRKKDFIQYSSAVLNGNHFSTFSGCQGARALAALGSDKIKFQAEIACKDGTPVEGMTWDIFANVPASSCSQFTVGKLNQPVYWQLATTGFDKNAPDQPENNGIEVLREYLDSDGKPVTKAKIGDILEVRLLVKASAKKLEDCVITDLLPGGLEMIIPVKTQKTEGVKYVDRQEDRLLLFVNLGTEPLEFRYKVRAATSGQFQIPPLAAEAMYDRGFYGAGKAGVMTIEAR